MLLPPITAELNERTYLSTEFNKLIRAGVRK